MSQIQLGNRVKEKDLTRDKYPYSSNKQLSEHQVTIQDFSRYRLAKSKCEFKGRRLPE